MSHTRRQAAAVLDGRVVWAVAGVTVAVVAAGALAWLRFRGPTLGYWDTYIAVPAMMANAAPVDVVLAGGEPAWQPALSGVLPADWVDPARWGIATADQRFSSAVAAAQGFALLGVAGFRALFALCAALVPLAALLLWRAGGQPAMWPGLVAGLVVACNPFVLAVDRLNPSLFALPALLAVWAVALRPVGGVAMAGAVFGAVAGMREEVVVLVPALTVALLGRQGPTDTTRARLRRTALFAVACVAVLVPTLHWKWFAFGNPLLHPSQFAHHLGFRPEFVHHLFGRAFAFNGLLNWPLHDTLVRTPHFAYPVWLLWPLVAVRALGTVLAALAVAGWARLWQRDRFLAAGCALWVAPLYLLFGPQENWEEVKMTFLVLALPALIHPIGHGLLLAQDAVRAATMRRALRLALPVGVGAALLTGALAAVRHWEVPPDPRWTQRFPNADPRRNPAARQPLTEEQRNDWHYFQRAERPEELQQQRDKLTAALPWPAAYLPVRWSVAAALAETRAEIGARRWRVLDIWGYIYGVRQWPQP